MKHSHTKIWIHLIWATKKREKVLFKESGKIIYEYLQTKATENKISFERLNIQPAHVHGLIDLPTDICLSDFIGKVKGSSSHWINQQKLFNKHFSWQRGFGAYSVSASQIERVKSYIQNQSEHHRIKSFDEEYDEWKKQYGIFYE